MPLWDGLTWFLCGGVDGRRLWPGASRVESSHREVVHCVRFQPRDVHQRVVSRYAHFANSVRLGVIFPVHDLLGRKKKKKKREEKSQSWAQTSRILVVHFTALLKFIFHHDI